MQQGLLCSLLLLSLALYSGIAGAVEMSVAEQQEVLHDRTLEHKVEQLYDYAIKDDIDALKFAFQRLALPQQEAARYLLFKRLDKNNISLSAPLYGFVQRQNGLLPVYQITVKGDGYEFSSPAFNYTAVGSRLMKRWKQDQKVVDFVLKAELHELKLKAWLSGPDKLTHEKLLIKELDHLSIPAIQSLVDQLITVKVTSWLPSSAVMVRIAQVSHSPEVYKLLWLMRADGDIEGELDRLSKRNDHFAIKQMMLAAQNPRLKDEAIKDLARLNPMNDDVKAFLVNRLSDDDEVFKGAKTLVEQGHRSWLQELLSSNRQVKASVISQVLEQ